MISRVTFRATILCHSHPPSPNCLSLSPLSSFSHRRFSTSPSPSPPPSYDVGIIGGGIVGIATARELLMRHRNLKVAVFEKEFEIGNPQH